MLTDFEIALLLRAAGLVCYRLAYHKPMDDDDVEFRQTSDALQEAAAKRMTAWLAKGSP